MKSRKYTDEQFIEAIKNSLSLAETMRTLGLYVGGSNYDTVKRKIKEFNLDVTHFTGAAWNQGDRYRPVKASYSLDEILVKDSSYVNTSHLRERLLKENIKERKCECCNNSEWMNKPIALELHHKNGIKSDLRIENLQILCPNCHSFTDNYRGKNIGMNAQEVILEVEYLDIGEALTCNDDGNTEA